jgi:hypothetical protein
MTKGVRRGEQVLAYRRPPCGHGFPEHRNKGHNWTGSGSEAAIFRPVATSDRYSVLRESPCPFRFLVDVETARSEVAEEQRRENTLFYLRDWACNPRPPLTQYLYRRRIFEDIDYI